MRSVYSSRVLIMIVSGLIPLTMQARAGEPFPFEVDVLDDDCPGGYQVTVADVDGDQQMDVLTLGRTVRWLKNGSWKPFPITGTQTRSNIDLAPYDIDGDGHIDLALASDFALESPGRGQLQWLRRTETLEQEWQLIPITPVPSTHRIRWADIEGTGKKVLVSAPILGKTVQAPDIDKAGARLSFFRIPADPVHDRWVEEIIDEQLPVTHGLLVSDFDGDGREDLLTASFEGVHLFQSHQQGGELSWKKRQLATGDQDSGNSSARGASEIRVGKLKDGTRYLATIEPWHGDQVVVYTQPAQAGALWERHVIATGLDGGHALAVLDVDGDGEDEIASGYRGKKGGVVLFRCADAKGADWTKQVLDEGSLTCQCLIVAEIPAEKRPVLIGIGGSTHNVKLFRFPVR